MTDMMIDMTSRPYKRYKINLCHYCDHDKYPDGKPIDPTTDHNAKPMKDGSWKCSECLIEEDKKMLSLFGGGTKEMGCVENEPSTTFARIGIFLWLSPLSDNDQSIFNELDLSKGSYSCCSSTYSRFEFANIICKSSLPVLSS